MLAGNVNITNAILSRQLSDRTQGALFCTDGHYVSIGQAGADQVAYDIDALFVKRRDIRDIERLLDKLAQQLERSDARYTMNTAEGLTRWKSGRRRSRTLPNG
jgi:hypothetical protein